MMIRHSDNRNIIFAFLIFSGVFYAPVSVLDSFYLFVSGIILFVGFFLSFFFNDPKSVVRYMLCSSFSLFYFYCEKYGLVVSSDYVGLVRVLSLLSIFCIFPLDQFIFSDYLHNLNNSITKNRINLLSILRGTLGLLFYYFAGLMAPNAFLLLVAGLILLSMNLFQDLVLQRHKTFDSVTSTYVAIGLITIYMMGYVKIPCYYDIFLITAYLFGDYSHYSKNRRLVVLMVLGLLIAYFMSPITIFIILYLIVVNYLQKKLTSNFTYFRNIISNWHPGFSYSWGSIVIPTFSFKRKELLFSLSHSASFILLVGCIILLI